MFRIRLSTFLLLMLPTIIIVLLVVAIRVPPEKSFYRWYLLTWLFSSVILLALFLFLRGKEMLRLYYSKYKYYVYPLWLLYPVLTLLVFFQVIYSDPASIFKSLIVIVPVQIIVIAITWSSARDESWSFSLENEKDRVQQIPMEIYAHEDVFRNYCKDMIAQGNVFEVFLAAKKGMDLPFLKKNEMDFILLEGQWRENEKNFNRVKITSETYNVVKARLSEAVKMLVFPS